jgi:pSer/pThr/pTyr-binding forkhead associated (FHA) protein
MGQQFALRFLAGKLQGVDYPLEDLLDVREVVLGRSRDVDVVLDETMVSRRHAKLYVEYGELRIEDLGSTNGTFVNGQKVQQIALKEGDRILVGTSLMKLILVDGIEGTAKLQMPGVEGTAKLQLPAAMFDPTATMTSARTVGGIRFSGALEEIPLLDLLQLLSTSKKSGNLEIFGPQGVSNIYLQAGQIVYATISRSPGLRPEKAVYRMLSWVSGTFELKPPQEDLDFADRLSEPTEALLLEAMRQLDEIQRLEKELPGHDVRLVLASPMGGRLRDLAPLQLDILQVVHEHGHVDMVLDRSAIPDLETYEALLHLLKAGFVIASS